jgi:uncharacterized membrane protein YeiB
MSAVHTPIHVDPADIPVQEVTSARITGIDMARGIAMAGMVIVHFVAWWETDGALSSAAELVRGRAMPLFMLLGGVGVTLMTTRTHTPTRNLLIRAVMLMALLLAIGLRMARSTVLAALVPAIVAIGAVTYQVVGDPRVLTPFDSLFTSTEGIQSLVIDGFYPLFPVGAFFIAGMWLGRIDLSSDRVAAILFSAGTIIGIGVWVGANRIVSLFNVQTSFGGRAGDGAFHWGRLLDGEGHSAMPAWTISALGTSAGVLGLSLLISRRASTLTAPLVAVGSLSLTFYVFQSWVTNLVPETAQTSAAREWAHAIAVFVVFTAFALLWKTRFRSGPLERLLRLGSGPKLQTNR